MTWEVVVTVTEAAFVHGLCDRVPVGVSSGGWQTGQAGWRAMSCSPSRCQPATCAARAAPTRGSINMLCSLGGLGDVVLHPRPLSRRQTGGSTADWRNHPATDGTTGRADMISAAVLRQSNSKIVLWSYVLMWTNLSSSATCSPSSSTSLRTDFCP